MKSIKAILLRITALLKLSIVKVLHFQYFEFNFLQIISPSTHFNFSGGGRIIFKKNIGTRRNVEFRVSSGGVIKVGERCFFNNNCMVVAHNRIEIGQDCSFGPNVLLYDHDHDFKNYKGLKGFKYKSDPIIIGDNVWIGANSVILRGTKIGDNCVIGAGAVIKGSFPNNSIIIDKRDINVTKYEHEEP